MVCSREARVCSDKPRRLAWRPLFAESTRCPPLPPVHEAGGAHSATLDTGGHYQHRTVCRFVHLTVLVKVV